MFCLKETIFLLLSNDLLFLKLSYVLSFVTYDIINQLLFFFLNISTVFCHIFTFNNFLLFYFTYVPEINMKLDF